ncbi:cytochrome c oxidase subunit II [Rosistilla oblonga]|uniref:cytochrome c oxidase subunit II n=1 Tax=Rosistilla oblonga TaxID=2527990 RepID=UPI003A97C7AC
MPQSTLQPAGEAAEAIAVLFYWMCAGAVVIWIIVVGLAVYAIYQPGQHHPQTIKRWVIGGGAVFPTIVLTGLLCASLPMMPELQRPAPQGSLQVHVSGVRWWWRISYQIDDETVVETANEIRLPVGRPVEFKLDSEDVIHSFWIPALGGKVDMMPGRQTRLKLHPTRVGTFRGVCAEFCGAAHAQMNFDVVVMPADEFDAWLKQLTRPPASSQEPDATDGEKHFFAVGCHACHAIRGTDAKGSMGPDLTHFGSRPSIAAGLLPNNHDNLVRWITETDRVKPGVDMPAFHTMDRQQAAEIATFLEGLK